MPKGWRWDETLYRGSAPFYARCRPPYAPDLADKLAEIVPLDGSGRLLDVGCGPGIVALTLAGYVAEAVGLDPDAAMLAEADRRANTAGIANVRWVRARAEDPPADLGSFRLATFAQSFHWMHRPRVAATVLTMLEPGGALAHISDVDVKGAIAPPAHPLPYPTRPDAAIADLVRRYLGPLRRAGQGLLRHGTPDGEATVLIEAGFRGPARLRLPAAGAGIRGTDDIVAWVYSLSSSAPHLFGDRADAFEADLRRVLDAASPSGLFAEHPPDTEIVVWRTGTPRR